MELPNINRQSDKFCTGCGMCKVICPTKSISVDLNARGFMEACADEQTCIHCGKCIKSCIKYSVQKGDSYVDMLEEKGGIFMGYSLDKAVRHKGSSGGIGFEISKAYLSKGYSICGACYNAENHRVEHRIAEDLDGAAAFIGSKYLQSDTTRAFSDFSTDRKYVVFGTPCQIYALRQNIKQRNIEHNFILIDFFCHGVPSYLLWQGYLEHLKSRYKTGAIRDISFRDKKNGWHDYAMNVEGDQNSYMGKMRKDLFYLFYLSNTCMNEPCYQCSFRLEEVYSDIRLGDFWGPKYRDENEGVSIVTCNTDRGVEALRSISQSVFLEEADVDDLLLAQPTKGIEMPCERNAVMHMLQSGTGIRKIYIKHFRARHLKNRLTHFAKGLIPGGIRATVKNTLNLKG